MPRYHRSTPIPARRPHAAALLLVAGLAAVVGAGPAAAQAASTDGSAQSDGPVDSVDYRSLWEAGVEYHAFFDAVRGRRDLWERNTARAAVPERLLARARAVPGRWRLLVVALDRCSDSASTIPWLAALADSLATLELRVVPPDLGRAVMAANPTPDGRPATPTVVLLDERWMPVGVWVERPSELQTWFIENPEDLSHDQRHHRKMEWYDADAGRSTLREIVELLESAP